MVMLFEKLVLFINKNAYIIIGDCFFFSSLSFSKSKTESS